MQVVVLVLGVVGGLGGAVAKEAGGGGGVSYWEFPPLFYLDLYEPCLARGYTYCLGTFGISAAGPTDPTLYRALQEYTEYPRHFNRTRVHRGFCATDPVLCPASGASNSSLGLLDPVARFQQCARDRELSFYRIDVRLEKLIYCRSRDPESPQVDELYEPSLSGYHYAFVVILTVVLVLNVVGTVFDLRRDQTDNNDPILLCWSVRRSWQRLVADYTENGDPRLTALIPIQGIRVVMLLGVITGHASFIHYMTFTYNPEWMEKVLDIPLAMLLHNAAMAIQLFFMISSFLLAYNLLIVHEEKPLRMIAIPKGILVRIARITPLYLVILVFSASWWTVLDSGPIWSMTAVKESHVCRKKFWINALFLNNLFGPHDNCLVQTWFLAVDFQLYIVAIILTVLLVSRRYQALWLFAVLFACSAVFNSVLVYMLNLIPAVYMAKPEWVRVMFAGVPSFRWNYIAPWGSAPACFSGLFLAFLHFHLQQNGFKPKERKWLVVLSRVAFPCMLIWIVLGFWVRSIPHPAVPAIYAGLDRSVFCIMSGFFVYGLINGLDNTLTNFFGAKLWHSLGRMSLAVLLVHWILNYTLVGSRHTLTVSSFYTISAENIAVAWTSYALAVPLTVFIETPMLQTLKRFS